MCLDRAQATLLGLSSPVCPSLHRYQEVLSRRQWVARLS